MQGHKGFRLPRDLQEEEEGGDYGSADLMKQISSIAGYTKAKLGQHKLKN